MADKHVVVCEEKRLYAYQDVRHLFHVLSEFGRVDSFEKFLRDGADTGEGDERVTITFEFIAKMVRTKAI